MKLQVRFFLLLKEYGQIETRQCDIRLQHERTLIGKHRLLRIAGHLQRHSKVEMGLRVRRR